MIPQMMELSPVSGVRLRNKTLYRSPFKMVLAAEFTQASDDEG